MSFSLRLFPCIVKIWYKLPKPLRVNRRCEAARLGYSALESLTYPNASARSEAKNDPVWYSNVTFYLRTEIAK